MYKRIWALLLSICLLAATALPAWADEEDDLRAKQQEAQAMLSETNDTLAAMSSAQQEIQQDIADYNLEIVDLMVRIDQAKADIADAAVRIDETNEHIEITRRNLDAATHRKEEQYADMQKRIQFIYENGGKIGWAAMLFGGDGEDDIASFLNRMQYTEELHDYDRSMLTSYMETIETIEEMQASLHDQLATQKEEKASYEAQKKGLEENEKELEEKLAKAQEENENYEQQIAEAREQANAIQAQIAKMQAEIERIQEEKRKAAEEAARKAAEEEARRKAAEEAAAKEAEEQAAAASGSNEGSEASYEEEDSYDGEGSYNEETTSSESATEVSSSGGGSSSGSAIVAYADRFLGNPYVWGGNSLTNGCDCSHFVYNVLKNCGVYGGGYSTSGGWAYLGRAVSSLSAAQAGDVIVYSGHVAIYDGNGYIVEAQNASAGITHNRRATCAPIVAIRRFI